MATELHSEIFRGIEYTYYHNNSTVTFDNAISECKNLGSELAYMKDVDTWNKIIEFLPEVNSVWWIGLRRKDGNSTWKWLDGTEYKLNKIIYGSDKTYLHCGAMQVQSQLRAYAIIQGLVCDVIVYHKYICQRKIPLNPSTATRVATTHIKASQQSTPTTPTSILSYPSASTGMTTTQITASQNWTPTTPTDTMSSYNPLIAGLVAGLVAALLLLLIIALAFLLFKVKKNLNRKPANDIHDYAEIQAAAPEAPAQRPIAAYEGSDSGNIQGFKRENEQPASSAYVNLNTEFTTQSPSSPYIYEASAYGNIEGIEGEYEQPIPIADIELHALDSESSMRTTNRVTFATVNQSLRTGNVNQNTASS